jgi:hypothetical protein
MKKEELVEKLEGELSNCEKLQGTTDKQSKEWWSCQSTKIALLYALDLAHQLEEVKLTPHEIELSHCCMCGSTERPDNRFVCGPGIVICEFCIKIGYEILKLNSPPELTATEKDIIENLGLWKIPYPAKKLIHKLYLHVGVEI